MERIEQREVGAATPIDEREFMRTLYNCLPTVRTLLAASDIMWDFETQWAHEDNHANNPNLF